MLRVWFVVAMATRALAEYPETIAQNMSQVTRLDGGDTSNLPNSGICESKDIMNSPTRLEMLRNCTIIAGYLKIILIDDPKDIEKYTFPELREVTEYVLMYRVYGLRSLGQLFPNLALIRGQSLFHNYALVLQELPSLNELGLRSLTTIQRGFVRIINNPGLCFADTVSWQLITGRYRGNDVRNNGPDICPGPESCRGCDDKLCWSSRYCQRMPKPTCNSECLGGCSRIANECYRCKHVINDGHCVPECPPDKFLHPKASMCVTEKACKKLYYKRGWTWNKQCIRFCPKHYKIKIDEKNNNKTCIWCGNDCNITCPAAEVTTLQELQYLKECNIINGSLHIRLIIDYANTENIMSDLMETFEDLKEIRGYLKIFRSASITSLDFFRNLTIIRGNELLHDQYAIVVYQMENLMSIWDWSVKKPLKILNGTIFFHFNAKLCVSDIMMLANQTGVKLGDDDVSKGSNGYDAHCHFYTIETTHEVLGPSSAMISWNKIVDPEMKNQKLSYMIYYIEEVENKTITHVGRDTCYDKGWMAKYVEEPEDTTQMTFHENITDLNGYTNYAYYIETYNKGSEKENKDAKNGRSLVKRFRTEMDEPPIPLEVIATSDTPDKLRVLWKDDPEYRGIITHYLIEIVAQEENKKQLDERNYCVHPPIRGIEPIKTATYDEGKFEDDTTLSAMGRHCTCAREDWDKFIQDKILLDAVEHHKRHEADMAALCNAERPYKGFHNEIGCRIAYVKNENEDEVNEEIHYRQERNIRKISDIYKQGGKTTNRPPIGNKTNAEGHHSSLSIHYFGDRKNYIFENLTDYGKYLLYVTACKGDDDCGQYAVGVSRTKENPKFDVVGNLTVIIINDTSASIGWAEPTKVNGAIISYTIEYVRVDTKFPLVISACIPRKQHEERNWMHTVLVEPGKYSVRVRAHSLGQDGEFSEPVAFDTTIASTSPWWKVLIAATVIGMVSILFYIYYRYKKRNPVPSDAMQLVRRESEMTVQYRDREEGEDDDRIEYYDDYVS